MIPLGSAARPQFFGTVRSHVGCRRMLHRTLCLGGRFARRGRLFGGLLRSHCGRSDAPWELCIFLFAGKAGRCPTPFTMVDEDGKEIPLPLTSPALLKRFLKASVLICLRSEPVLNAAMVGDCVSMLCSGPWRPKSFLLVKRELCAQSPARRRGP